MCDDIFVIPFCAFSSVGFTIVLSDTYVVVHKGLVIYVYSRAHIVTGLINHQGHHLTRHASKLDRPSGLEVARRAQR